MAKQEKRKVINYFMIIFFIFILAFIVVSGNSTRSVTTSNINTVKSIQSSRIIKEINSPTIRLVKNTNEIKKYGKNSQIQFIGTLTGYGPDCPGCEGPVYCKPNPNVKNGNIYFDDSQYGKLRILAADYSIPCGSIVKIENYKYILGESFYGIVLDRGSAIVGLTMDLLYPSEKDTIIIGRQRNIRFTIERWGW